MVFEFLFLLSIVFSVNLHPGRNLGIMLNVY